MGPADLMPLPDALNHIRAGGLGSTFATLSRRLLDTQVAGFQGREVPSWIGEAADAYTDSIRTLGDRVRQVASSVGGCSSELASWAEAVGDATLNSVPKLHARYTQADLDYQRQVQFLTTQLSQAREPVSQEEFDQVIARYASERDAEQEEVLREYERIMTALDDEAARVAKAIQAAVDQAVGIEGWSEGGGGNRTDLATELFNDIPVVDGQAEFERAQRDAQDAASYIGDLELTEEDVTEFTNRFGDRLDNPYFAAALSELVTPEQMTQFIMEADHLRLLQGQGGPLQETFDTLVSGMGHVMVISTGGIDAGGDTSSWEGFHAARKGLLTREGLSLEQLGMQRAAQWKEAGRLELQYEENVGNGRSIGGRYFSPHLGYEYMGLMMGAAAERYPGLAVGAVFCRPQEDGVSLAQDIVLAERANRSFDMASHGSYGIDFPTSGFGGGTYRSDVVEAMLTLMDEPAVPTYGPAGAEWTWRGYREADLERYDAVQSFLLSEVPSSLREQLPLDPQKHDTEVSMARYLSGFRWEPGFLPPDKGEALGKLLAELSDPASWQVREQVGDDSVAWRTSRERQAAKVAAEFFEGYQDGLEVSGVNRHRGRSDFGDANPALRNWAGQIMEPYISDLGESISGAPWKGGVGVDVDLHQMKNRPRIVVSAAFLERLCQENGFFKDLALDERVDVNDTPGETHDDISPYGNPPASEVLLTAALRGYDEDLDWAFNIPVRGMPGVGEGSVLPESGEEPPLSRRDTVAKVVDDSAAVLQLMNASGAEVGIDQGEAKDAATRRFKAVAKFVLEQTKVGGLLNLGEKEAQWADRAYHQAGNSLLESIFVEGEAAAARVERAESREDLEVIMTGILQSHFYEGGRLNGTPGSPGEIPADFRAYLSREYPEISPDSLPESWWEASKDVRAAYGSWITQKGHQAGAEYDSVLREVAEGLNRGSEEYFEQYRKQE